MAHRKRIIGIKILCFFIIALFILFIYARYVNTKGLRVHEIAVITDSMSDDYNGFKIVHFSDVHYGRTTTEDDLSYIVQEINKLKPDIIVFTGDLFDSVVSDSDIKVVTKYLEKLEARLFKFAVMGDYDKKYEEEYVSILEDSDFIFLDNSTYLVYDNSTTPINIVGLSDTSNISELYNNDYFTITLVHEPDSISNIYNSDIVLAGHSMGGQIKIPFIGGIIKKDGANTYINDFYEVNSQKLYISSGIGTERFSFRLFNKPSINFYRLYNY